MITRELAKLQQIVEPVVRALDCDLWGIEYLPRSRQALLRIYIDAPDGIDVDDCERVSRQLSAVFDVEDPLPGEYLLEVSSPGMDRILFTLDQCRAYVGSDVRAKLFASGPGRKKYRGRLVAVEGEDLLLEVDGEQVELKFGNLEKVRIVPFSGEPQH